MRPRSASQLPLCGAQTTHSLRVGAGREGARRAERSARTGSTETNRLQPLEPICAAERDVPGGMDRAAQEDNVLRYDGGVLHDPTDNCTANPSIAGVAAYHVYSAESLTHTRSTSAIKRIEITSARPCIHVPRY